MGQTVIFILMKSIAGILVVTLALGSCGKSQPCVDTSKIDYNRNCGTIYDPVCGCDEITYYNPCDADRSGVVSWIGGPCFQ